MADKWEMARPVPADGHMTIRHIYASAWSGTSWQS